MIALAYASGLIREVTLNMLLGGGVWQCTEMGGARRPPRPPVGNGIPRASSRSAVVAFFARMDILVLWWRGGGYGDETTATTTTVTTMSLPWQLREQALDGTMRAVAAMSSHRRWAVDEDATRGGADDARRRRHYRVRRR